MKCKNPHCKSSCFNPVVEMKTMRLIGVICENCGARYDLEQIDISEKLKRSAWNSAKFKSIVEFEQ